MIDTIVFELRDLAEKHEKCANRLFETHKYETTMDVASGHTWLHREVIFKDKDSKVRERFRKMNPVLASSNYKARVVVSWEEDKIKFEMSLPKYFHAHNISQLVPDLQHDLDFSRTKKNGDIGYNFRKLWDCMKFYIKTYMRIEFKGLTVDYKSLVLTRFDICYNQYFPDETKLLNHLRHLKKITPKYARDEKKNLVPYDTGVFYHTDDYSVKIYHKGPEFKKDDGVELSRANRNLKPVDQFDIEFLQTQADCILRYEFMFRSNYISKLYNRRLFRVKDKQWIKMKKLYNEIALLQQNNELNQWSVGLKELARKNLKTTINTSTFGEQNLMRFMMRLKKIRAWKPNREYTIEEGASALHYFYDEMSKVLDKSRVFYFDMSLYKFKEYEIDRDLSDNIFESVQDIKLGEEIMKLCSDRFLEFMSEFKLKQKDSFEIYKSKLNEFNKKQQLARDKSNFPLKLQLKYWPKKDPQKMKMLYDALRDSTLKKVQRRWGFSNSTYKRYNNHLKDLGFYQNSVELLFEPPTDYVRYYQVLLTNSRKFFKNSYPYFHKGFKFPEKTIL